jgi:hypothetical protein
MNAAQAFTGLAVQNPAGLAMSNYSDTDSVMGPNFGHGLGNPIPPQQPSFTSSFYSDRTAPHFRTPKLESQKEVEAFGKNRMISEYLLKLKTGNVDDETAFGELFDHMVNHVSKGRPGGQQLKNEMESFYFQQINPKARGVLENGLDKQRKYSLNRDLLALAKQMDETLTYWNLPPGISRTHGGRKIARNYSSRNGKKTSLRKLKQRSRKHKTRTKTKKT